MMVASTAIGSIVDRANSATPLHAAPMQRRTEPSSTMRQASERLIGLIQSIVSSVYAVELQALLAPSRGLSRVAHARQVGMYLSHVVCRIGLTEIGRAYGRDRTTVRYACGAVEDRRDDPDFDLTIELIAGIFRHLRDATCPDLAEQFT